MSVGTAAATHCTMSLPQAQVAALPDWMAMQLAEIDQFTAQHRLAANTLALYEDGRKTWQMWSGDLGHEAWPASPEALLDVLTWICGLRPGDPGPGLSASRVDGVMAAICDMHRTSGWPHPFAVQELQDVRQAVRQILRDAMPTIPTPPVTLAELRVLVGRGEPARTTADAVREVVAILHLLGGISLGEIATLHQESDAVLVTDTRRLHLSCSCRLDAASLCLACAAGALPRRNGQLRLYPSVLADAKRQLLRVVEPQSPAPLCEALLVAAARPAALSHYRQRAWILLMFDKGIRSLDVRRLARADLRRTPTGRYQVTVQRAAKDPLGATIRLSIHPQDDPMMCPVRAVDVWLALRDAQAFGSTDELTYAFAAARGKDGLLRLDRPYTADQQAWRRLCEEVALADLTQHGLRTGFICEAHRQGFDSERVGFTVGHVKVETTYGYQDAMPVHHRPHVAQFPPVNRER